MDWRRQVGEMGHEGREQGLGHHEWREEQQEQRQRGGPRQAQPDRKFSFGACMALSGRPKAKTVVVALRCCWKAARAGIVAPDRTYLGGFPIRRVSTCAWGCGGGGWGTERSCQQCRLPAT